MHAHGPVLQICFIHYTDVTMTTMASQITSLTVVYSTVYSDADQRKHQSSASLAFVWGIHRDRWIPRTKGQLRGKCFHLMTSSCENIVYSAAHHLFELSIFGLWCGHQCFIPCVVWLICRLVDIPPIPHVMIAKAIVITWFIITCYYRMESNDKSRTLEIKLWNHKS